MKLKKKKEAALSISGLLNHLNIPSAPATFNFLYRFQLTTLYFFPGASKQEQPEVALLVKKMMTAKKWKKKPLLEKNEVKRFSCKTGIALLTDKYKHITYALQGL